MQRRLTKAATATNLESGDQKRVGVHRWEFSAGDFCFFYPWTGFHIKVLAAALARRLLLTSVPSLRFVGISG